MKKLYTAILIIALALFISCDEKKAEDDIKKAFTKITDEAADVVDAVDKITPKPKGSGTLTNAEGEEAGGDTPPPLTKPVLSSYRVRTGQAATFSKVLGHSYELKQAVNGVSLEVSDKNTGRVRSTQAASGVVVVATLDDSSEESDPIEFVDVTLTKPAISAYTLKVGEVATFSKVLGHTYELKQAVNGVTLHVSSGNKGRVTATQTASGVVVVATLDDNTEESDPINFIELTKPAVSSYRVRVGQAATFSKVEGHSYELKEEKTGVALTEVTGNRMQVTATQSAQNVIIVATLDDNTEESDPINFIELTKPAVSSQRVKVGTAVTFPKVLGHTYELKQAVNGVSLDVSDENMGQVRSTQAATGVVIVATLDDSSEDSEPIEFFIELTKPVPISQRAPWNLPIIFPKVPEHTYTLKEKKTGVALSEAASDTMQVTATQSAQNVIIVATFRGSTTESNPIEFTRIQGNTVRFKNENWLLDRGDTLDNKARKIERVAADTRNIKYSISPTGRGVSIDSSSGKVTAKNNADLITYTVTAELEQSEKYKRATDTYTVTADTPEPEDEDDEW